jgi:hypothetical protein
MTAIAPTRAPYPGLVAFSQGDADRFFGRAEKSQLVIANVTAHRLTLLYGPSGVGKSSLLEAGVAAQLNRRTADFDAPDAVFVVFRSWHGDPSTELADAVEHAVAGVLAVEPEPAAGGLAEGLDRSAARLDADLVIALDQFDDFFTYSSGPSDGELFERELARAVNRGHPNLRFLISLREDGLAQLDRFKGSIPNLFGNYLRLDHLDRARARDAITGPLRRYSMEGSEVTIEPALVEAVLDGLTAPSVGARTDRIETAYLQLVMSRIWHEERAAESPVLRLSTLDQLGGTERLVSRYIGDVMDALPRLQRDDAADVLRFLTTPSGTAIAFSADDLAYFAEMSRERVDSVLARLEERRIVRRTVVQDAALYELAHGVLAPAVLQWRMGHLERRRGRLFRRRR